MKLSIGFLSLIASETRVNEESGTVFHKHNDAIFYDQTESVNLNIVLTSPSEWLENIKKDLSKVFDKFQTFLRN
jgi:hypothetical protein